MDLSSLLHGGANSKHGIQIFGVKKDVNTRKAQRFFAERRIKTHFVDLSERAASLGEIKRFAQKFGVGALIDQHSRRYGELVNDVLDLSKIEAGKIDIQVEVVEIPALMQDLFTTIRPMAGAAGSEVTLVCEDCGNLVKTDPRRVRQIVLNLLSNATKFGWGKPISVRCTRAEGDGVAVSVTDQGLGIPEKDLHRVFEEFVQIPTVTLGGTGLGLPISRRLAEVLGGRLEVESKVGTGSTFRLILPREAAVGLYDTRTGGNGRHPVGRL